MAIKQIKIGNTVHDIQTTIANVEGLQSKLDEKVDKDAVDAAFSDTSTNPIQNKVVADAIDELRHDVVLWSSIDAEFSDTSVNPIQNKVVTDAIYEIRNDMVGWSSVDSSLDATSTNPIQNKVVAESIDEVTEAIQELESNTVRLQDIDTVLSSTSTNPVQNKVVYTQMSNLSNRIDDIDEDKQDILVSGTNIKTINGESLLGSGDISVDIENAELITVDDIDAIFGNTITMVDLDSEVTF